MTIQAEYLQYPRSASFARRFTDSGIHAHAIPVLFGSMSDTQPISPEPQAAFSGTMIPSYLDEYYHCIHIRPQRLDLGNVLSNITREVEVWNAHFESRTLINITPSGSTEGMALSGQTEPPLVYAALQSRVYTLAVYTAGAPVIDAAYRFDFGTETPRLEITGRRIVIFPFGPDWADGMTERLEWATDVLTAYGGTEQRVRLRQNARRSLEYRFIADGRHARRLDALLFGWGGRIYALPVWHEADWLTAALPAGATSINVTDAALKDYRAGGLIVLVRDSGLCEAVEIAGIAGNVVTLKLPLANTFPLGSRVLPAVLARIDGEAKLARPTENIAQGTIRFAIDDAIDRAPAEIGPTWQNYAVLDERPDRAEDVEESWSRTLTLLDAMSGIVTVDDTSGSPIVLRQYRWLVNGRAAIDRWKRWASARAGRLNPLWLPTFADDVSVTADIKVNTVAITVSNGLYSRYVAAHPLRAALRIETVAGQVFHRRITAATERSADEEILTLDTALGVDVPVSGIRRVMFMGLARLDGDALEIHYETDRIAVLAATFRGVTQ